jgi:hypothetical protein
MPNEIRAALIAASLLAGCSNDPPPQLRIEPIDALPGKWGWEGSSDCQHAPLAISFSEGGKRMHISHEPEDETGSREPRRVTSYSVLSRTNQGLSMLMDDEDRLDASGKPVSWNLVLLDENQYCWNRSDWRATACTKSVLRCS